MDDNNEKRNALASMKGSSMKGSIAANRNISSIEKLPAIV
jgi:hypothetical protein